MDAVGSVIFIFRDEDDGAFFKDVGIVQELFFERAVLQLPRVVGSLDGFYVKRARKKNK